MFGYLIDMDGVIYHGNQLIPGAERFIAELSTANVPFMFLTNNSQRTRRDVVTKLERMGISVLATDLLRLSGRRVEEKIRHDAGALAAVAVDLAQQGRRRKRKRT